MKVAILSESPPDESAIAILAGGVLGSPVERVEGPSLRSRGWPSVRSILPVVIKHLYFRTDADGLVVVVDSDTHVAHREGGTEAMCQEGCRLCELRIIAQRCLQQLPCSTAVEGRRRFGRSIHRSLVSRRRGCRGD